MARHLQLQPVLAKAQVQSLLTLRVAYLIIPSLMELMSRCDSFPNFTFTNEPAGTYTVSVTDGNSCTITQPNVVVPSNGFAFVNGTPITTPTCLGQNNGTIIINITGGVGPNYTFLLVSVM